MKHFLFFLGLLTLPILGSAQDYNELLRTADRLYNDGKYGDAGEFYEKAWRVKTARRDLIYKAGQCYYWVKDYRKAADCYAFVKHDNEEFELVGLKYARSLKQDGRYREAMEEFKWFARDYKGPGKEMLDKIIVNDITGCAMGIELSNAHRKAGNLPVEVVLLPESVNSLENEFAPVPFTDDLLFFTSMVGGRAKLFRTVRQDGQWQLPAEPQGLPDLPGEHFGNGAFAPDGSRFYFTQCSAVNTEVAGGNGLRARCEIFVIRKTGDGTWGAAERLRDYINLANATNTHPYIFHENGQEYLYFSSDRPGGFGGLDLYVCERPLESDELDFSLPRNLGDKINTGGEEIAPFFDPQTQTLYFSSNGLVSLGGLDIFKAIRSSGQWTRPENIGVPFNSTADDFFFTLKKSGNGGFFVSNRLYGRAKPSTRHEDIFEFFPRENKLFLSGKILDGNNGLALKDCMIGLYENLNGEEARLLQVQPSADGTFKFPILPERQYSIEVSKDEFETATRLITNQHVSAQGFYLEFILRPMSQVKKAKEQANAPPKNPNTAPAAGKTLYRIQLEALPEFNENEPKYEVARLHGRLSTEPIQDKTIVRVLVGDFDDKKKANDIARELRNSLVFPQAFVVRYVEGARQ